ncbi:NUDIX domain-containing protein [Aliikangiella maris]|uniref:NUDIX domain-containing protein n=2 Tax=Aliikangiella maris TaxID=3162458 RepID=A0ABV3MQ23_9GAMM
MKNTEQLKYEILKTENGFNGYFKINRYTIRQQLFAGGWSEPFQRELFERGHAAAVLLLDPLKERLALVEQFRPGAMETEAYPWITEPVAGIIETGETPGNVVRRESIEEAGCEIKRLRQIYKYLVSPGGCTETVCLYLGEIDSTTLPELGGLDDENEDIRIVNISIDEAFQRLDRGEFNNAMMLIAIQWLKLNWSNRENIWENSEIEHKN